MKKIKKLIVALILGLFAFIPFLFVKEDVKANDTINDVKVLLTFDQENAILDNTLNYTINGIDYNYDILFNNIPNIYSSFYVEMSNVILNVDGNIINNFNSSFFYSSYYSFLNNYILLGTVVFEYEYDGNVDLLIFEVFFYITSDFVCGFEYIPLNITELSYNYSVYDYGLVDMYFIIPSNVIGLNNLDIGYNEGYNEGYEQAKEDVILKDSPLLNGQLMIYDYENTLLESEPIDSIYLNNDGTFKYGLIYDRVSSALNDSDNVRVDIIFSYPITPNDMLQEYLRNSTSLNINSTLSSLSWIASNGYYVDRDITDIDSNYEIFDFNLVPNVQGVSFTARVSDLINFSYGVVESVSDRYYNDGYEKGYYDGTLNTDRLVNDAFDDGYDEGLETGYDTGYNTGYSDGMLADYSFSEDLIGVAEIPFNVIFQILNFEILGINVWGLITGVLTIVLAIWLFRKFRV